jgi:succinate dehydrogenase (ubiquinone) membrane anchor subunit
MLSRTTSMTVRHLTSSSALRVVPVAVAHRRHLHSSTPPSDKKGPADDAMKLVCGTAARAQAWWNDATETERFHASAYVLAGAVPAAMVLSPSFLCVPVDLALGVVIPYHQHIGVRGVLTDYLPPPVRPFQSLILYVLTGVTTLGLFKINLCGAGITETVKSLWRAPEKK